jgi:hypothetical protein
VIPLEQLQHPSASVVGQYLVDQCWAERHSARGQPMGQCPLPGKPELDGLCPDHHADIFGVTP